MVSGDNIYDNFSNSSFTQAVYWCPSQYASPFPNQSTWQGTLRPETWTEKEEGLLSREWRERKRKQKQKESRI